MSACTDRSLLQAVAMASVLAAATGPARAQAMPIPAPSSGLMPNAALGKGLYAKHCAQCHGASLAGTNNGPPLVHRVYEPSHHGDAAFQIAVRYGVRQHHWKFGDMSSLPGVSADDVAHITSYVRAEQRNAGIR